MSSAAIASPLAQPSGHAPAFFVRTCEKLAAARAALLVAPPQPQTIRSRRRLALLSDETRRGGVRVVSVFERERLDGFAASLVAEIRDPRREHYLAWSRLAARPAAVRAKLRALLSRPAAPERHEKMPVTTAPAAA